MPYNITDWWTEHRKSSFSLKAANGKGTVLNEKICVFCDAESCVKGYLNIDYSLYVLFRFKNVYITECTIS